MAVFIYDPIYLILQKLLVYLIKSTHYQQSFGYVAYESY
jgi:hypothetical protein